MTGHHVFGRWHFKARFTLIELLVVVGIIAILMTILLPALSKAKRSAKRIACLSQQKQLALGTISYAQDNEGQAHANCNSNGQFYGGGQHSPDGVLAWYGYLGKTKKNWKHYTNLLGFACPEFYMKNEYRVYANYGVQGYSMNYYAGFTAKEDNITGVGSWHFKLLKAKRPAKLFIWADGNCGAIGTTVALFRKYDIYGYPAPRHSPLTANFAFADGHAGNFTEAKAREIEYNNL